MSGNSNASVAPAGGMVSITELCFWLIGVVVSLLSTADQGIQQHVDLF